MSPMPLLNQSIYLCPSDRAARAFQRHLSRESIASATCIELERFFANLWRRGQLFGLLTDSRELLDADASAALWRAVVADETNLMSPESARAASLAHDAWTLANRFGLAIRQIAALASGHDNQALFARCAVRMEAVLRRTGAITQSELCAQLALRIDAVRSLLPEAVVLTPTFTLQPGQKQLLTAFGERGISVAHWVPASRPHVMCHAHEISDEQQEMRTAIAWAKAQIPNSVDGDKVVAIIVPNLAQCRARWLSALREQLNPDQWWLSPESDRARFNLSMGESLSAYPWVASLTTVLRASVGSVDTEVLAQALAHPRWGGAPTSLQRLQRQLRRRLERGEDRSSLLQWIEEYSPSQRTDWDEFFAAASQAKPRSRDSHLASLLALSNALTEHPWIAHSDLFQLQEAWSEALRRWVAMDRWLPPLTWRGAVHEITSIAGQQTFQPQSGAAKIQVMGLLESAGVPLDAAWIVGFTDRVLPEAYKPNLMLPRAWQASAQVGLGSHDEVRRRADALWANWNVLCGELHVSFAGEAEGSVQRISPLAVGVALLPAPSFDVTSGGVRRLDRSATSDESLPVAAARSARPPLTSSILEQQAHCPRKAAATRLNLREWPEYAVGITARLRGDIAHHVMHTVGKARIQQTLDNGKEPTLEMLHDVAAEAFKFAVKEAKKKRPAIASSVWAIERDRLLPLIDKVLALDAARIGFTVAAVEESVQTEVFNSTFKLRLDRRDSFNAASDDERYGVVLDYKTGNVSRADLFAENSSGRLAAPQLPLYMFALHAALPVSAPRIGAMGYVVISDDEVKFVGVGADAAMNPKRPNPGEPDWPNLTLAWQDQLGVLVEEHRAGVADVAPLKGTATCRYCAYAGFCREPWSLSGAAENADDVEVLGAGKPA